MVSNTKFETRFVNEIAGKFLVPAYQRGYYFMANAYTAIKNWFDMKKNSRLVARYFDTLFADNVKIIWYEVDETEDANAMFTRLNIGKIPLTSAELVKAIFLGANRMNARKQDEIALQWDNIEIFSRLDEFIKSSVALKNDEDYLSWTYEKNLQDIKRLLLLFNVESVR